MSAAAFKRRVLRALYEDVHTTEVDNYAPERFSFDGVDRSNVLDYDRLAWYLDWFGANAEQVYFAHEKLADQESRDLYLDLLRYRLSGHLHVRIRSRVPQRSERVREFKATFTAAPSELPSRGMFGALVHYDQIWEGRRYTVDTNRDALIYPLVYRQYHFERNGIVIRPESGDHVVDGGACLGDTAVVFSRWTGSRGHVYALEPVQDHLDVCNYNFGRPGYENITALPYGLSDRSVDAPTIRLDGYNPGWRPGEDDVIPLRSIDDLVMDGTLPRVDFIKMDIEGSEFDALNGAVSSLRRFRPRLAISIYHQFDDYFRLQHFIDELGLGYRFYIDHHTIWDEETVLYAISDQVRALDHSR
jgi:FkbM family methyltransferase